LISDDLVTLTQTDAAAMLSRPSTSAPPAIEAWGIGILPASPARPAPLSVIVDLGEVQTLRHPEPRFATVFGLSIPILQKVETPAFPDMIRYYLLSTTL